MTRSLVSLGAALMLGLAPAPQAAAQDTTSVDSARRAPPAAVDSVLTPAPDETRGMDAELRMALFDLVSDRPLSALNRLQPLAGRPAAAGDSGAVAPPPLLRFLLVESYYRLGMGDAFRSSATMLASSSDAPRFAAIARTQLMVDAYRHGDDARVLALATATPAGGDRGLAGLVTGLASYRSGDFAGARAAFAAVRQDTGGYAPYASYMDALATIGGDTLKVPEGVAALQALAGSAAGDLADEARLTAAELAYQAGQYAQAATLTASVTPTSGFAAEALLTRAWSLYMDQQLEAASAAFVDFAARYPQLSQRDEARLMAAQILLEGGHTDSAAGAFQMVSDSVTAEMSRVSGSTGALGNTAHTLVAADAAGLLFVGATQGSKTLVLPEQAGVDDAVLLGALGDSGGAASPGSRAPSLVSVATLDQRLQSLDSAIGPDFPRRIFYLPASGSASSAAYTARAEALREADVALALARYRLSEAAADRAARLASIGALQQLVAQADSGLDQMGALITSAQDSLARLAAQMEAARARVRAFVVQNAEATRQLAMENLARQDSLRSSELSLMDSTQRVLLDLEQQTASMYRDLAESVAQGVDAAIAHHPVFALRDSLARRITSLRTLLDQTRGYVAANKQLLAAELARMQQGQDQRIAQLQAAVNAAQTRRTAAEAQLSAVVETELRARTGQLSAMLHHDVEAADYGSASAAFFKATETAQTQPAGAGTPGGTPGTVGSSSGGAPPPAGPKGMPPLSR